VPLALLLALLARGIALVARGFQLSLGRHRLLRSERNSFSSSLLVSLGLGNLGLARGALFSGSGFAGEARSLTLGSNGGIKRGLGGERLQRLFARLGGQRGPFLETGVFVGSHKESGAFVWFEPAHTRIDAARGFFRIRPKKEGHPHPPENHFPTAPHLWQPLRFRTGAPAMPDPAQTLPSFAPVPRAKDRTNGWKPEVQRAFIEALAETGSVKSAARRVGRAEVGAYLLRRHPEAEEFRKAWDIALDIGMRRIEDVAMDRALHGHEQPVYSYGKLVGTRTVYNDRLLMFMLRNRASERFPGGLRQADGARGRNALDQMELTRLKKQWHKEWAKNWERERAVAESARTKDRENWLEQRLETMHRRWFLGLGPNTRSAYRAFREAELADPGPSYDQRYAVYDAANAREDLEKAGDDPDAAQDARDALAEAEMLIAAQAAEQSAAEADYAQWFNEERRAKVWWAIDVVFGAVSAVDGDSGEEQA
jgi:hypothetical protein